MFHSIGGLSVQERIDNRTRAFDGTGTPYLKVTGLKAVHGVRVGTADLPLEIDVEYPANEALKVREIRLPLVILDHDDAGTPVLLRSVLSNDGIWQEGEKNVYVTGEWDDAVPAPAPAKAPAKTASPILRG